MDTVANAAMFAAMDNAYSALNSALRELEAARTIAQADPGFSTAARYLSIAITQAENARLRLNFIRPTAPR